MRILIVEDEEDTRKAFANMLKKRGHEILETAKGQEAIEIIEKEKPDMVYLDISLADDVTGMEVLKQSKLKFPEVEIVMMSAYESEYKAESLRLGAHCFCTKPITKLEQFFNPLEEIKKKKGL